MKLLQVIYEFHNKEHSTTCGLYHVEMDSGDKYYLLRNNESVGAVQHILGVSASECIAIIRDDVKKKFFGLLEGLKCQT